VKSPADPNPTVRRKKTAISEFWSIANQRGGAAKAAQLFRDARRQDPSAFLFPEFMLNQLAYARLQGGDTDEAVDLFKLNVEAYPASANARDSLADGCAAARGENDLALAAEQKCLELLPADTANEQFKATLRRIAEQKIAKYKAQSR
jgi:tetratricopeptide (TPR) repeat protein